MKFTLFFSVLSLLFVGCTSSNSVPPQYRVATTTTQAPIVKTNRDMRPKHEMKEVDEKNFSDSYMYPEDGKLAKKDPVKKVLAKAESNTTIAPVVVTSSAMGKAECIAMMGEDKFIHYTQVLGSQSAAIKRCAMLKAMQ